MRLRDALHNMKGRMRPALCTPLILQDGCTLNVTSHFLYTTNTSRLQSCELRITETTSEYYISLRHPQVILTVAQSHGLN